MKPWTQTVSETAWFWKAPSGTWVRFHTMQGQGLSLSAKKNGQPAPRLRRTFSSLYRKVEERRYLRARYLDNALGYMVPWPFFPNRLHLSRSKGAEPAALRTRLED